jgi:hypothetical protein
LLTPATGDDPAPKKGKGANVSNRMRWTYDFRLALKMLWDEFNLTNDQKMKVFNRVFATELAASTYFGPVSFEKMNSQWVDRGRKSGRTDWARVLEENPDANEVASRDRIRQRICATMQSLGYY